MKKRKVKKQMKRNKWLAIAMAAVMGSSLFGCSGDASSVASGSGTANTELAEGGKYSCSEEPLTLTAHIHWNNGIVLNDDMIIPKEAARFTNITLKGTASPMETDSAQAFNLMITGKHLPDIVGGDRVDINKYGLEGAFMPLNDLIEEYAPDI